MRKQAFFCDVCGTVLEHNSGSMFSLFVDRTPDGAGGSSDDYLSVDFCPEHLLGFTRMLLRQIDEWKSDPNHRRKAAEWTKTWLKELKSKKS